MLNKSYNKRLDKIHRFSTKSEVPLITPLKVGINENNNQKNHINTNENNNLNHMIHRNTVAFNIESIDHLNHHTDVNNDYYDNQYQNLNIDTNNNNINNNYIVTEKRKIVIDVSTFIN